MLNDIEDELLYCFWEDELEDAYLHYEGNKRYEERFRNDATQLYEELESCSNPFNEDGEDLEIINSKWIKYPASSTFIRNTLNFGLQVYDKFCEERLVSEKHFIYGTILLTKLPLFCQENTL